MKEGLGGLSNHPPLPPVCQACARSAYSASQHCPRAPAQGSGLPRAQASLPAHGLSCINPPRLKNKGTEWPSSSYSAIIPQGQGPPVQVGTKSAEAISWGGTVRGPKLL